MGSIPELGSWDQSHAVWAKKMAGRSDLWMVTIQVPCNSQFTWQWVILGSGHQRSQQPRLLASSTKLELKVGRTNLEVFTVYGPDATTTVRPDLASVKLCTYLALPKNQILALIGSAETMGAWNPERYVPATENPSGSGNWSVVISVGRQVHEEWKWVVVDRRQVLMGPQSPESPSTSTMEMNAPAGTKGILGKILKWEEGQNRLLFVDRDWMEMSAPWGQPAVLIWSEDIDTRRFHRLAGSTSQQSRDTRWGQQVSTAINFANVWKTFSNSLDFSHAGKDTPADVRPLDFTKFLQPSQLLAAPETGQDQLRKTRALSVGEVPPSTEMDENAEREWIYGKENLKLLTIQGQYEEDYLMSRGRNIPHSHETVTQGLESTDGASGSHRPGYPSALFNRTSTLPRGTRSLTDFRDKNFHRGVHESSEESPSKRRRQEGEHAGSSEGPELPYHVDDYLTSVGDVVNLSLGSVHLSQTTGSRPRMDMWGADSVESSRSGSAGKVKKKGQDWLPSKVKMWLLSKLKRKGKTPSFTTPGWRWSPPDTDSSGRKLPTSVNAPGHSNTNVATSGGNSTDTTGGWQASSHGRVTHQKTPSNQGDASSKSHQLSEASGGTDSESISGTGSQQETWEPTDSSHRSVSEYPPFTSVITPDDVGSIFSNSETAGVEVVQAAVLASASLPADSSEGDLRGATEVGTNITHFKDSKVVIKQPSPPTISPLTWLKLTRGESLAGTADSEETATVSSSVKQGFSRGDPKFLTKVSIGAKPRAPSDAMKKSKEFNLEDLPENKNIEGRASTSKKPAVKDARLVFIEPSSPNVTPTHSGEDLKAALTGEPRVHTDIEEDHRMHHKAFVPASRQGKADVILPNPGVDRRDTASTVDSTKKEDPYGDLIIVGKALSTLKSKTPEEATDWNNVPVMGTAAKLAYLDQQIKRLSADVRKDVTVVSKKRSEVPSPSNEIAAKAPHGQPEADLKESADSGPSVSRHGAAFLTEATFLEGVATNFESLSSVNPGPSNKPSADGKSTTTFVPNNTKKAQNISLGGSEREEKFTTESTSRASQDERRHSHGPFTGLGTSQSNGDIGNELEVMSSVECSDKWNFLKNRTTPFAAYSKTDITFEPDTSKIRSETVKVSSKHLFYTPKDSTTQEEKMPFLNSGVTTERPQSNPPSGAVVAGERKPSVSRDGRALPTDSASSGTPMHTAQTSKESLIPCPIDPGLLASHILTYYSDMLTERFSGDSVMKRHSVDRSNFFRDGNRGSLASPTSLYSPAVSAYSDNTEKVSQHPMPNSDKGGTANLRKRSSSGSSSASEHWHEDPRKEAKFTAVGKPGTLKGDRIQNTESELESAYTDSNATIYSDYVGYTIAAKDSIKYHQGYNRSEKVRPTTSASAQNDTSTELSADQAYTNQEFSIARIMQNALASILPSRVQAEGQEDAEMVESFDMRGEPLISEMHEISNADRSLEAKPGSESWQSAFETGTADSKGGPSSSSDNEERMKKDMRGEPLISEMHEISNDDRSLEAKPGSESWQSAFETGTADSKEGPSSSSDNEERAPKVSTEITQNIPISDTAPSVTSPTPEATVLRKSSREGRETDLKDSSEHKSTTIESDRIKSQGNPTSDPDTDQHFRNNYWSFIRNLRAQLSKSYNVGSDVLTKSLQGEAQSVEAFSIESVAKDFSVAETLSQESTSSGPLVQGKVPPSQPKGTGTKDSSPSDTKQGKPKLSPPSCDICRQEHIHPWLRLPKAENSSTDAKQTDTGEPEETPSCTTCGKVHAGVPGDDAKSTGSGKGKGKPNTAEESTADSKDESISDSEKTPSKNEKIIIQHVITDIGPMFPHSVIKYFQGRGWDMGGELKPKDSRVEEKTGSDITADASYDENTLLQKSTSSSLQTNTVIFHSVPKFANCPQCGMTHSVPWITCATSRKKILVPAEHLLSNTEESDEERKPILSKAGTTITSEASESEDSKLCTYEPGWIPSKEETITTESELPLDIAYGEKTVASEVTAENKLRLKAWDPKLVAVLSNPRAIELAALTTEGPKIAQKLRAASGVIETESVMSPASDTGHEKKVPCEELEIIEKVGTERKPESTAQLVAGTELSIDSTPYLTKDMTESREEVMKRNESAPAVSHSDQDVLLKTKAGSKPKDRDVEITAPWERPSWNFGAALSITIGNKECVRKFGVEGKPDILEECTTDLKDACSLIYDPEQTLSVDDYKLVYRVSVEDKEDICEHWENAPISSLGREIGQKYNIQSKAEVHREAKSQQVPVSSHQDVVVSKAGNSTKVSKDEKAHSKNKQGSSMKQRISQGIQKIVEMISAHVKHHAHAGTSGVAGSKDKPCTESVAVPTTPPDVKPSAGTGAAESRPSSQGYDTVSSEEPSCSRGAAYSGASIASSSGVLTMPSWNLDPPPGINVQKLNKLIGKQESGTKVEERKDSHGSLSNNSNKMLDQGKETASYSSLKAEAGKEAYSPLKAEAGKEAIDGTVRGSNADRQAEIVRWKYPGLNIHSAPASSPDFSDKASPKRLSESFVQRAGALAPVQRGINTLTASEVHRLFQHETVTPNPQTQQTLGDRETTDLLVMSPPISRTQDSQCGDDCGVSEGTQTASTSKKESHSKRRHSSNSRRPKHKSQATPTVSVNRDDYLGRSDANTRLKDLSTRLRYSNMASAKAFLQKKSRSKSPTQRSPLNRLEDGTERSDPIHRARSPPHSPTPSLVIRYYSEKTPDQNPQGYDVLARRMAWDREWRERQMHKRHVSPTTSRAASLEPGEEEYSLPAHKPLADAESHSSSRSIKDKTSKRRVVSGRLSGSREDKQKQDPPCSEATERKVDSTCPPAMPPSPVMGKKGRQTLQTESTREAENETSSTTAKRGELNSHQKTEAHTSHGITESLADDRSYGSETMAEQDLLSELPFDHPAPPSSRQAWPDAKGRIPETTEAQVKVPGRRTEGQVSSSYKRRESATKQGGTSFLIRSSTGKRLPGGSEQPSSPLTQSRLSQGSPGKSHSRQKESPDDLTGAAAESAPRTQVHSGSWWRPANSSQQHKSYDYRGFPIRQPFAPAAEQSEFKNLTKVYKYGKGRAFNTLLSLESVSSARDAAQLQPQVPPWQFEKERTGKSVSPTPADAGRPPGYRWPSNVGPSSQEGPTVIKSWWTRGVYKNEQSNCACPRQACQETVGIDEVPSGLGEDAEPCILDRGSLKGLQGDTKFSASRRRHSSLSFAAELPVENKVHSLTSIRRSPRPNRDAVSKARPWSPTCTCRCQFAHAVNRLLSEAPRAPSENMRRQEVEHERTQPKTVSSESCLSCSNNKSSPPGSSPRPPEGHPASSTAIKCLESNDREKRGKENSEDDTMFMEVKASKDHIEEFLLNVNGNALTSDDCDQTPSIAFVEGAQLLSSEIDIVALLLPKESERDNLDEPCGGGSKPNELSPSTILEQDVEKSVDRNFNASEPIQSTPETDIPLPFKLVGGEEFMASEERFLNESCNGNQFSMQFVPDYDRPPALTLAGGGRAAYEILSQLRNHATAQRTCPGVSRCRMRPRRTNKGLAVASELYRESCQPRCVHACRLSAMTVLHRHHVDELLPKPRSIKQCANQKCGYQKKKKTAVSQKKPTRNVKTSIEELHVLIDRVLEGRTASLRRDRSCPLQAGPQVRSRAEAQQPSPSPTFSGHLDKSHNFATEALLAKVEDISSKSDSHQDASLTECMDRSLGFSQENVLEKDWEENTVSSKETLHSSKERVALTDPQIDVKTHSQPNEDFLKPDLPVDQDASEKLKLDDAEAAKTREESPTDLSLPKLPFATESLVRRHESKDIHVRVAEWVEEANRRIEELDRASEWSTVTPSNTSCGQCLSSVDVRPSVRRLQLSSRNSSYTVPRVCSLGLNVLTSTSSPDIPVQAAHSDYTIFSRGMNLYLSSLLVGSGEKQMSFYYEKKKWDRESARRERQHCNKSRADEFSDRNGTWNGSKASSVRECSELGATMRGNRPHWMSSVSLLENPIAEDDNSTYPTLCNEAVCTDQMISTKGRTHTNPGSRSSPKRHRQTQKGVHTATPEKQSVLASVTSRIRNLTCCVPTVEEEDTESDSTNSDFGFKTEPYIIYDARQKAETVLRLIANTQNISASNSNANRGVCGQEARHRGRRVLRRSTGPLLWTPHYTAPQTSSHLAEGNFLYPAPSSSGNDFYVLRASGHLLQPEAPSGHCKPRRRLREGERGQPRTSAWDELFRVLSLAGMLLLTVNTDGVCHTVSCSPTVTADVILRAIKEAVNSGTGSC